MGTGTAVGSDTTGGIPQEPRPHAVDGDPRPERETGHELHDRHVDADDGWITAPDGSSTWVSPDGDAYGILVVHGRRRLVCRPYGNLKDEPPRPLWESHDARECRTMARFVDRQGRLYDHFLATPMALDRDLPRHGLSLTVRHGKARLTDAGGREAGHLHFVLTPWESTWILGRPTVNGASWLRPDLRGKGLGRVLYDAVEEVCGLPMVPHGRRYVGGGLSADSERFWRKRAIVREVPGFDDPGADEREERHRVATAYIRVERRTGDPLRALVLARELGHGVEVAYGKEEGRLVPYMAWALLQDGRALDSDGIHTREEARERARVRFAERSVGVPPTFGYHADTDAPARQVSGFPWFADTHVLKGEIRHAAAEAETVSRRLLGRGLRTGGAAVLDDVSRIRDDALDDTAGPSPSGP